MAKVNLTLGESKTSVSLTLETKEAGITWDDMVGDWDSATSTWDAVKITATRESKTKISLTLEAK